MTISRLFQWAMPPERHLLNKVFAADLLIRWSAPKGHRTPETIHAELDKRAKKGERQKFWLFWTFGEMRVPRAAGPSTETN